MVKKTWKKVRKNGIGIEKFGNDKFDVELDQMELSGIGIDKMELTPCTVSTNNNNS